MTHSPMRWILALPLALCAAACRTNPAIPFQADHWQFFVLGGRGAVKDDFVEQRNLVGLEMVVPRENTKGWCHEFGLHFASGEGNGVRNLDHAGTIKTTSERELDFRELLVGARQVYNRGESFEPYFGVGLSLFRVDSHETFLDASSVEHHNGDHWNDYGVYLRTGVLWNTLRGVLAEETELKLGLDMRGLYASDYSALEFALVLGLGK